MQAGTAVPVHVSHTMLTWPVGLGSHQGVEGLGKDRASDCLMSEAVIWGKDIIGCIAEDQKDVGVRTPVNTAWWMQQYGS